MKRFFTASLLLLAVVAMSAFGSDPLAPEKPADVEEQVKALTAKIELLEKRIVELEKIKRGFLGAEPSPERQASVEQLKQLLLQRGDEQLIKDAQRNPQLGLPSHTEVGVPFDVERAMLGEMNRFQQYVPQERYEFRVEPGIITLPKQK